MRQNRIYPWVKVSVSLQREDDAFSQIVRWMDVMQARPAMIAAYEQTLTLA